MSKTTARPVVESPVSQEQPPSTSAAGCLLRIYWMFFGTVLVVVCAYRIVLAGGVLSGIDIAYWILVASLVIVRYLDIRYQQGTTTEGETATMAHWRRYTATVTLASLALWLLVHAPAWFGWT